MPYFSANGRIEQVCGFPVSEGGSRLLGRNTESTANEDSPITLECVSRRHASIGHDERGFFVEDLDSTNGVFINGEKVTHRVLVDGDSLSLGDPNATHFTYIENEQEYLAGSSRQVFDFDEGASLTIGRAPNNDIVLQEETTASACHAKIRRIKGACWITDLGSTNGTWINGDRVKSSKVLSEDIVFVGSSMLRMEIDNADQLKVQVSQWNSSIRLECVALSKVVGQGLKILNDINLSINPGEFVGILGPSGAGKSTLLKALNGFSPPSSGTVLMNDLALFKSYALCKNLIGYVPQEDVIHEQLTVAETLIYIARLRLAGDQSDFEIQTIVNEVLDSLRLQHVAQSQVESLSGGQRKRVSVGVELLTKPALLFLDEPTSGLDPSTEEKLMRHLREMSRNRTTTLITTHILYNLELLDTVIFMAKGRVVFYGTPAEALEFFSEDDMPIDNPIQIFDLLEGEIQNGTPAEEVESKPVNEVDAI